MHKIIKAGNKAYNFLSNYFKNRMQCTALSNTESTSQRAKTWVPKASTLGPLLSLIFINDLPLGSLKAAFALSADHAALTVHTRHLVAAPAQTEMVLDKVNTWCHENKSKVNNAKTEHAIYGMKMRKTRAQQIQLKWVGSYFMKGIPTDTWAQPLTLY